MRPWPKLVLIIAIVLVIFSPLIIGIFIQTVGTVRGNRLADEVMESPCMALINTLNKAAAHFDNSNPATDLSPARNAERVVELEVRHNKHLPANAPVDDLSFWGEASVMSETCKKNPNLTVIGMLREIRSQEAAVPNKP